MVISANSVACDSASLRAAPVILPGERVGDRYRILRLLGQEGPGRIYLAEDTRRSTPCAGPCAGPDASPGVNQGSYPICVLKEFSPQISSLSGFDLEKAQDWFAAKANLLCQLDHPNLAPFRELVCQDIEGWHCWFVVQDYVEGQTYRAWLQACQRRGQTLAEADVVELLRQMLSALDYLQGQGLSPQAVSPDVVIQRRGDGRPMLVDCGGIQQAVAQPREEALAFFQPALYSLGTTALTLLSGLDPRMLRDPKTRQWTWSLSLQLQPGLTTFLGQLLAQRPVDRYISAAIALHSLNHLVPPTPGEGDPDSPIDFSWAPMASASSHLAVPERAVPERAVPERAVLDLPSASVSESKSLPRATNFSQEISRSRRPGIGQTCAIALLGLLGLASGLGVGLGRLPLKLEWPQSQTPPKLLPTEGAGGNGRR